jgi:hypothetical protein
MLNKIKICAFGMASCFWGCSQAFSMTSEDPVDKQEPKKSFVEQGKNPLDKCLRFFTKILTNPSPVRSKYSDLTKDLLNVRDDAFTASADARAFREFLSTILRDEYCPYSRKTVPFIFNILKYVLLRLGPTYKPHDAAVYISALEREIPKLREKLSQALPLGPRITTDLALEIIQIIDSYEGLSVDEKLSVAEFFLTSWFGDVAASLSTGPDGGFEKVILRHSVIERKRGICFSEEGRLRFDELTRNPRIKTFFDALKDEINAIYNQHTR